MEKIIVCVINEICHVIKYTDMSIEVLYKCNAFDDSSISESFNEVRKKYNTENDYIRTAGTVLDAVVRDRVRDQIDELLTDQ